MTSIRLPIALVATLVPSLIHARIPRAGTGEPTGPSIAVSGAAEIRVAPDEVVLRFTIEGHDPKLADAVEICDTSTEAVLAFVRKSRVAPTFVP